MLVYINNPILLAECLQSKLIFLLKIDTDVLMKVKDECENKHNNRKVWGKWKRCCTTTNQLLFKEMFTNESWEYIKKTQKEMIFQHVKKVHLLVHYTEIIQSTSACKKIVSFADKVSHSIAICGVLVWVIFF